jgi:CRP-like cAMP-binding protein
MQIDTKRALFSKHPLFGLMSPAEFERVFSHAHLQAFARGDTIFSRGDQDASLVAVVTGIVRISVLSSEGRELVLNTMGAGDVLGEIALLDGRPRTADAIAWTDCELLILKRRDFLPVLRETPDLMLRLLELLCSRLRQTTEQAEELKFLHLSARLAKVLLRLSPEANPRVVTATQRELGELIGITREHVNKQLKLWEGRGLVEVRKGCVVILDLKRLAAEAV